MVSHRQNWTLPEVPLLNHEQMANCLRIANLLLMLLSDTFAAGFGLVPGSIFSAAQNTASSWFHYVAGVTAVGHCAVEGKFSS